MEKSRGSGRGRFPTGGGRTPPSDASKQPGRTGHPRPKGPPDKQLPASLGTPVSGTDRPSGNVSAQVTPRGVGPMPTPLAPVPQVLPGAHSFVDLQHSLSTFIAGIHKLDQELPALNREKDRTAAICRVLNDCNTHKNALRALCDGNTDDPAQAGILRSQAREAIRVAVREACVLLERGNPKLLHPGVISQFANGLRGLRDCLPFHGTAGAHEFDQSVDKLEILLLKAIQEPSSYPPTARRWKTKEYAQVMLVLPVIADSASGLILNPHCLFGSVMDRRDPPDQWDAWGIANALDALGSLVTGHLPAQRADEVSSVATHVVSQMVDTLTTNQHNGFAPLDCRQALGALLQLRRAGVDFGGQWQPALRSLLDQIARLGGSGTWTPRDVSQACRTLRALLDEGLLQASEPALQAAMDTLLPLSFDAGTTFEIARDIQERIDLSSQPVRDEPDPGEAVVGSPLKEPVPEQAEPSMPSSTVRPVRGRGGKVPVSPRHQGPRQAGASSTLNQLRQCKTPDKLCDALVNNKNVREALALATPEDLLDFWHGLSNAPEADADAAVIVLAKAMPADKLPQCASRLAARLRKSPADGQLVATARALTKHIDTVAPKPCSLGWICDIVAAWAPLAKLVPDTVAPALKSAAAAAATVGTSKTLPSLQAEQFNFAGLSAALRALARLGAVQEEPALLDDFIEALAKRITADAAPKWSKTSRTQAAADIAVLGPICSKLPKLLNALAGREVADTMTAASAGRVVYALLKDMWTKTKGPAPVIEIPAKAPRELISMFVCGLYDSVERLDQVPEIVAPDRTQTGHVEDAERTWLMSRAWTFSDVNLSIQAKSQGFLKMFLVVAHIYRQMGREDFVASGRDRICAPYFRLISTLRALPDNQGPSLFTFFPVLQIALNYQWLKLAINELKAIDRSTVETVEWVHTVLGLVVREGNMQESEFGQQFMTGDREINSWRQSAAQIVLRIEQAKDVSMPEEDDTGEQPAGVVPAQGVAIAMPSAPRARIGEVVVFIGPGVIPPPAPNEQELLEKFKQAAGEGMKVTVVGDGRRPLNTDELKRLSLDPSCSAIILMRPGDPAKGNQSLAYAEGKTWTTVTLLDTLRQKGAKEFHVFAEGEHVAQDIQRFPKILDGGKVTCNVYSGPPQSTVDGVVAMIGHHAQGNLLDDPSSDRGRYVRERIAQDTGVRVRNVSFDPASNTVKNEFFSTSE